MLQRPAPLYRKVGSIIVAKGPLVWATESFRLHVPLITVHAHVTSEAVTPVHGGDKEGDCVVTMSPLYLPQRFEWPSLLQLIFAHCITWHRLPVQPTMQWVTEEARLKPSVVACTRRSFFFV